MPTLPEENSVASAEEVVAVQLPSDKVEEERENKVSYYSYLRQIYALPWGGGTV